MIARADNAFAEICRIVVGNNVDQSRGEIGVGRCTRREENQLDRPSDLDLLLERRR